MEELYYAELKISLANKINGAKTNCRNACNLGIVLMNSNFVCYFVNSILVISVQISICLLTRLTHW